uniref:Uncharacterized protein n=1 Tax=Rhizophora mucronata TaxID=61149 RepID=A0A2P2PCC3_RHIMU
MSQLNGIWSPYFSYFMIYILLPSNFVRLMRLWEK